MTADRRYLDQEGARAAERNEGVDWKALSHTVRVGYEALELLESGSLTYPSPTREHLRAIKAGEVPYAAVAAEIDALCRQSKKPRGGRR